ncbi:MULTISPECIES: hypothetical protein [Rhodococcus]|uniref:Uncharacterized protein n=2 Tax=Nocardiaceae TaxID=85025 RepID=A0A652YW98_NOCGL|nr:MULTISPECIES: hypothetical protein [Rhodococcus]KJF23252.1 hypothetical protein SZ00_00166 [Rhodococcus sp. AD45]MDV6268227.1 hypothetical protein [Rhodococcus globerulus]PVX64213.1 hypothetical protein C8E04_1486 [Rhodococcus globerulus]
MKLGSIADMFDPPYGELVKMIIGFIFVIPVMGSIDMNFNPVQ